MKLSIIVPVYNTSPFLHRCVDSLLAQGLKEGEYEIILINDGSKDHSLDICKEYEQQYPSVVRVFSQENRGLSATRNKGIREACGEYVCLIDSDDYLIPGGFRYLIDNYLEPHIDILSYWILTLDKKVKQGFVENNDVTGRVFLETMGREFLKDKVQTFVVSSLFRRSMLVDNVHFFQEDVIMCEDVLFSVSLYMMNPSIRMVSSRLYRYDLRESSLTHQRSNEVMRKAIRSYVYLLTEVQGHVEAHKEDAALCQGLKTIIKNQFLPFMSRILSSDYSVAEMNQLKGDLKRKGILPLKTTDTKSLMVNVLFHTPFFIRLYEWGYQKIFIPYVLPRLSRN